MEKKPGLIEPIRRQIVESEPASKMTHGKGSGLAVTEESTAARLAAFREQRHLICTRQGRKQRTTVVQQPIPPVEEVTIADFTATIPTLPRKEVPCKARRGTILLQEVDDFLQLLCDTYPFHVDDTPLMKRFPMAAQS